MIVITGASGQLGRLVIQQLLKTVAASHIVAAVRSPEKATDLAALGIEVRKADYNQPDTLDSAFVGAEKVLLISSSEVGQRLAQHKAVIEAAKRADVKLLAYTSVLRADTSPLALAAEHHETEIALAESGVPTVLLRNGWYHENYTMRIPGDLAHGVHLGSAGEGRISSAARADYAAAAVAVLTASEPQAGKTYELAGDTAFTLREFAAEVARQAGKPVVYTDLPEAEYKAALLNAGLPEGFAQLLANSDTATAQGALFDEGRQLSRLIGRATTPLSASVAEALQH
ncbi:MULTISPECIES: SDR family oxidoreductase [unclassified Pseudomonas]|uniref:SDR family oxidoreductase n=1 Tax=unclassified Pseudomonas TaxID=196821 RepID=UPI000D3C1F49|nr:MULTISPECIES: SDR family oxidoreductase [unclassified Pseudomonas]RAU41450.1 SDR family NAD(P)-dependent oxidoreductase [Pseudomonas sp. RIT 409]RAU53273.1 SDR family NAD(P)-dependent oxidoreductase [Pseudomonas sp. RIT 412]